MKVPKENLFNKNKNDNIYKSEALKSDSRTNEHSRPALSKINKQNIDNL